MTITVAGFSWKPPSSLTAIFRHKAVEVAFENCLERDLKFRSIKSEDWAIQSGWRMMRT